MMLSGVLLMLLSVPGYLEHNSAAERDIKTAVNFVVAGQTYDGNFPASVGEVSQQHAFGQKTRYFSLETLHVILIVLFQCFLK